MSSQRSSPIRIACPRCGGNVKVPPFQAGQKCSCPRCGAEIITPGATPPEPAEGVEQRTIGSASPLHAPVAQAPAVAVTSAPHSGAKTSAPRPTGDAPPTASTAATNSSPASDPELLRLVAPDGGPAASDEFGISCLVCGTRLHVRPSQVGTTIKCPDCYSPVVVKPPPKSRQPKFAARKTPTAPGKPAGGPTAMQIDAQARLERARVEQEQEQAEERERSAERFTDGLLAFFVDRQALARLAILALWLQLATTLFRSALGMTVSRDLPAIVSEAASLLAAVTLGLVLLSLFFAAAACALALVRDTFDGLRTIEHWPGANFLNWGWEIFYVINAAFLAALPGVALGIALALVGIRGLLLFTAATSFVAFFPPILLSMFETESATAPFSREAWESVRERPDPWTLTYLITTVVTIGGLFGFVTSLLHGFPLGLAGAVLTIAGMMIYFRTVGRLFCRLAGRDEQPSARP